MTKVDHKFGSMEIYTDRIVLKKNFPSFPFCQNENTVFYFQEIVSIVKKYKRPFVDDPFIWLDFGGNFPIFYGSMLKNSIPFRTNEEMEAAYAILIEYFNAAKA